MAGIFDLEGQLGFYAQYHHNTLNILCHVVGVPLIVWSLYVWLASLGGLGHIGGFEINGSTIGQLFLRRALTCSCLCVWIVLHHC